MSTFETYVVRPEKNSPPPSTNSKYTRFISAPYMAVSIERARETDGKTLAEISKRAFDSDVEVGAQGPGGPQGYDSPEAQINNMKWTDYYKILLDDLIVGGIMVCGRSERHCEICGLFVDPQFHNKGIATRAFELIWGAYPRVEVWTLGTPEWNVRTKHFYEKLGFQQVGWTKEGYGGSRGRWYEKRMDQSKSLAVMKIGQLTDGMSAVVVEGKVEEVGSPNKVRSKDGRGELAVANARLADETGSVVLVLWNEQIGQVSVGNRLRIENGYVGGFRGVNQLRVGRYGKLVFLI